MTDTPGRLGPDHPELTARRLYGLYSAAADGHAVEIAKLEALPPEYQDIWYTFAQLVRDYVRRTQP